MPLMAAPSRARQETGPLGPTGIAAVALAAVAAVTGAVSTAVLAAPRIGTAGAIVAALACLPLVGLALGQSLAYARRAKRFSEYATHAAELTEAQHEAELRRAALTELGRRALTCTDPMALTGDALAVFHETVGAVNCILNRRLADGEIRNVAVAGDVVVESIPPGQPSQSGYALESSEPVISNDLVTETRFGVPASVLTHGLVRSMSARVPQRNGAHYVLLAQRRQEDPAFTTEEANFLRAVAFLIGGAFDREASEQELRRQALEDPLTGLASRTLLFSHLEAELRHGRRLGDAVSVLVIELDRFKLLNDTLGHSAGDEVLRQVAARLLACVREDDLVARQGGD